MLEFGNKNRTQHPTDANAESSRSHAVFQVEYHLFFKFLCRIFSHPYCFWKYYYMTVEYIKLIRRL